MMNPWDVLVTSSIPGFTPPSLSNEARSGASLGPISGGKINFGKGNAAEGITFGELALVAGGVLLGLWILKKVK